MTSNIYDNLDNFTIENSTENVVRKAKKKLREIETLKSKPHLTQEEKEKLRWENYWKIFLPSSKKFIKDNKLNITHS